MRRAIVLFAFWTLVARGTAALAGVPVYDADVIHTYPHDPSAFTEGLFYLNGFLYESTGLEGHSSIRKVQVETGKIVQQIHIPSQYFGEGIVNWGSKLMSLTWQSHVGFVFDLATLKRERQFGYPGEGWALTQDGRQIIMSDGTSELRFLNPTTLLETRRLEVTFEGKLLRNLNELEWVKGEIYANIWQTHWIVRIEPRTGQVVGLINLAGLLNASDHVESTDGVLNGIAYDAAGDRLFVTGKNWPKLFEVRLKLADRPAMSSE